MSEEILRLMAITDDLRDGVDGLCARVTAAVRGGATSVQIRLKDVPSRVVAEVTRAIVGAVQRPLNVPVIVNDRFDIALAAGAAGVHVGADDVAVADIRRVTPAGFIVGASVGCEAEVANAIEADYVGIGPIATTGTKADAGQAIGVPEFTRLAKLCSKPAIGVGGITPAIAMEIVRAGGAGVAVISGIFATPDPEAAAEAFKYAMI